MTDPTIDELRARLAQIDDLRTIGELLGWDQRTMMPPDADAGRAEQLATVERLAHELLAGEQTGRLLDAAAARLDGAAAGADGDDAGAAIVRVTRRDRDKARRVPAELRAEMARSAALGEAAWLRARAAGDFALVREPLQRNVELARRYADCFDDAAHPYDALLDDYEPQMRTSEVAALFERLKEGLVPLVAAIAERADAVDASCLHEPLAVERQRELVRGVLGELGFAAQSWRLDDTAHPFAVHPGGDDIRITTRWDESYWPMALFGSIHEFGHGLYEAQVGRSLARTGLASGVSLGLHESQSRMWENLVGRGRPFCALLHARLRAIGAGAAAGADPEQLYRAVNRVAPSLIRVEADEVTYCLHIILRFELELALIDGTLAVADLPGAFDERMRSYLGLEVPDDARGVLQDVHWPSGAIGYFPTYAIGNVAAAQIWRRAGAEIGDIDERIAAGDFAPLREWLAERLHRHGRMHTPGETLQLAAGAPLAPEPYLDYLRAKFGEIYGLDR